MMKNLDDYSDCLFKLNSVKPRNPFQNKMPIRSSWPLSLSLNLASGAPSDGEISPGHRTHPPQCSPTTDHHSPTAALPDWPAPQEISPLQQYMSDTRRQARSISGNLQQAQLDYMNLPHTGAFENNPTIEAPYPRVTNSAESPTLWTNWEDFQNQLVFTGSERLSSTSRSRQSLGSISPTDTYLEVISLPSTESECRWTTVDRCSNLEVFQHNSAIFNPSQTLHLRNNSDSSNSDCTAHTNETCLTCCYDDIPYPYSPGSENYLKSSESYFYPGCENHDSDSIPLVKSEESSPIVAITSIPIKTLTPSRTSSNSSSTSPPTRRNSTSHKSPTEKATRPAIRRSSTVKKEVTEKRVGRRRGPLLPEQRKQASEIRKLRACLRCKFLKKTCDKGEPCAGCQPSHARLWQVPCTRIDIKDIAYFMKDWRADYDRLIGQGISFYNIQGFAEKEQLIWITHGYGFAIPIMAREVFVLDDSCFRVEWVESFHKQNIEFNIQTERMSVGSEGISSEALSEYLDMHLEGQFASFLDEYFEGTPFITDILKTAHRYYIKEQVPVIQKALKLVLAYNLTLHVTLVEQRGERYCMEGLVNNVNSKYNGKIIAPVMINFQIKCALADIWRNIQKEILVELSSLYSSVYSGDRFKNWPTIFMLASIILAVWEEMQFDSHFRLPDETAAHKFCSDMETTPVGVIIGLFHAISQKLPSLTEWDTRRHGQLLNNNMAVCEAMTEMKLHVTKYEKYLRTRPEAQFDSRDFDSLSNKFLSKLVIRARAH
ncbi:hypothetical protein K3495_g9875 [Podosphaera aphanis]|nr:hypothetical protein K3495_g9875 [Podosphaera aphanis]